MALKDTVSKPLKAPKGLTPDALIQRAELIAALHAKKDEVHHVQRQLLQQIAALATQGLADLDSEHKGYVSRIMTLQPLYEHVDRLRQLDGSDAQLTDLLLTYRA